MDTCSFVQRRKVFQARLARVAAVSGRELTKLALHERIRRDAIEALKTGFGFSLECSRLQAETIRQVTSLLGIRSQSQRRKRQSGD